MTSLAEKMVGPAPSALKSEWLLDRDVVFLNHGSFGACPTRVLERQSEIRAQIERQPVRFFVRDLQPLLDDARDALAHFLGAEPSGLVYVDNATTGINTVLTWCGLEPGDEVIVTNQEYNACRNALDVAAARTGARIVEVEIPFPVQDASTVLDPVLEAVTDATRLVLIDHVVSQTGMVLPIEALIETLNERGIASLIDGAHAPGMLPLDLRALGATYYTGNCHKWLCAPKGAAFLYVRPDHLARIRPLVISHGANAPVDPEARFRREFDWMGTRDPTPMLCVPEAIEVMGGLVEGGWPALMRTNRALALEARALLCAALDVDVPCPDSMIGALVSIPLPDGDMTPHPSPLYLDPVQDVLLEAYHIEVPIIPWPAPPRRLMRLSAQIYNHIGEYEYLASVLLPLLEG